MRYIKKVIVETLLALTLLGCVEGCQSDKSNYQTIDGTNQVMKVEFNQEQYIWQGFLFPTNRTSGVQ